MQGTDVDMGKILTGEQRQRLVSVLEKYRDVFQKIMMI